MVFETDNNRHGKGDRISFVSAPKQETLDAVSQLISHDITLSIVGIDLDKEGNDLARKMIELGQGRLYSIKELENVGTVVLDDYYAII